MVDRAKSTKNIVFCLNSTPHAFVGDGNKLTSILYKWNRDEECEGIEINLEVDGAFVAIGHTPNTHFIDALKDESGYLKTAALNTGNTLLTTCLMSHDGDIIEGVFAAGDCADKVYRQAVTAAGEGCKTALDAERYLSTFK